MGQNLLDLPVDVAEHELDSLRLSQLEVALDPQVVSLLLDDIELAPRFLFLIVGSVQELSLDQVQVDFLILVLPLLLNC